jgi:ribosomal protein S18 acetylase RimI-like enzyme
MTPHTPIRPLGATEHDRVAALWHRAGRAAYPYLPTWQSFTLDAAREVFRTHIAAACNVYVIEHGGGIAGYLALRGSYMDRLYVDPARQRLGLGTALVRHAQSLSPSGLELHTHQQNVAARSLYQRLGFVAVGYGVSPPPESAPDVEYHWRP